MTRRSLLLFLLLLGARMGQAQPLPRGFLSPNEFLSPFLFNAQALLDPFLNGGGLIKTTSYGNEQLKIFRQGCFQNWHIIEVEREIEPQQVTETLHLFCQFHRKIKIVRRGDDVNPTPTAQLMRFRWPNLTDTQWFSMDVDWLKARIEYEKISPEEWEVSLVSKRFGIQSIFSFAQIPAGPNFEYLLRYHVPAFEADRRYKMISTPDSVSPRLFTQQFFQNGDIIPREEFLSRMALIFRDQYSGYIPFSIQ